MGDSSTKADEDSFGFGFNNKDFSDRILRIEIIQKVSDDCVATEGEILHVNSLILAAKSPFFYKLFINGMIESQSKDAVLRIYPSEKASLMDLLKFMYQNTLSATTYPDLLAVLIVADKFEVTSCMRYCIQQLLKVSMSLEFALSCLHLPLTMLGREVVKPLMDASKCYLVERYKDFNKSSQEEALRLPLAAIVFVLGNKGLKVDSEDVVFDFVLKWGLQHYPKLIERRDIVTKILAKLIRFQYMSCTKLKEVLVHDGDFKHEEVNKLVVEALFFKVEVPYGSSQLDRHYKYPLIKVVEIESPSPHCIIFFDLKREECENLYSSKRIDSQSFLLGGRCFFLSAECREKRFGLYVKMKDCSATCDLEIAAKKYSTMKFERKYIECSCDIDEDGGGVVDVFKMPWRTVMSDHSDYFIDDVLHLRVEMVIDEFDSDESDDYGPTEYIRPNIPNFWT